MLLSIVFWIFVLLVFGILCVGLLRLFCERELKTNPKHDEEAKLVPEGNNYEPLTYELKEMNAAANEVPKDSRNAIANEVLKDSGNAIANEKPKDSGNAIANVKPKESGNAVVGAVLVEVETVEPSVPKKDKAPSTQAINVPDQIEVSDTTATKASSYVPAADSTVIETRINEQILVSSTGKATPKVPLSTRISYTPPIAKVISLPASTTISIPEPVFDPKGDDLPPPELPSSAIPVIATEQPNINVVSTPRTTAPPITIVISLPVSATISIVEPIFDTKGENAPPTELPPSPTTVIAIEQPDVNQVPTPRMGAPPRGEVVSLPVSATISIAKPIFDPKGENVQPPELPPSPIPVIATERPKISEASTPRMGAPPIAKVISLPVSAPVSIPEPTFDPKGEDVPPPELPPSPIPVIATEKPNINEELVPNEVPTPRMGAPPIAKTISLPPSAPISIPEQSCAPRHESTVPRRRRRRPRRRRPKFATAAASMEILEATTPPLRHKTAVEILRSITPLPPLRPRSAEEIVRATTPPPLRPQTAEEIVRATTAPPLRPQTAEEILRATTPPPLRAQTAEEVLEATTPPPLCPQTAEEILEVTTPPPLRPQTAEEILRPKTLPSLRHRTTEESLRATTPPPFRRHPVEEILWATAPPERCTTDALHAI